MILAQDRSVWPHTKLLYSLIGGAAIVTGISTAILSYNNPVTGMDFSQLFLIRLAILIPLITVWILAARGARRFKSYVMTIKQERDGRSMNYLANALVWLVAYIVVLSISNTVIALLQNTTYVDQVILATNHIPLIIAIFASWQLFMGSRGLVGMTRGKYWTLRRLIVLAAPYTIFMIIFAIHFYQSAPDLMTNIGLPRYTLPVDVLMISYVLPHMVIWLLGIISVVNIAWYAKNVPGTIYKSLFKDLFLGITLVYVCIFLAQLLRTVPIVATNFGIGLTLVYGVLLLAIAGFSLIFRGSAKLQKIEEIT